MSLPDRNPGRGAVLGAFLKRDWLEAASYKFSFVYAFLESVLSLATFFFVAKLVPRDLPALAEYRGDYFSFVVVGLAFSGLLGLIQSELPGIIRAAQTAGTLEALLVTPAGAPTILLGSSLYSFAFGTARAGLQLAVAAAFFGLRLGAVSAAGTAAVFVLTALCAFGVGLLGAAFVMVYKKGNPFGWILGSVSGLFGGAFFPVALLPSGLRWISSLLPLRYALDGMRRCLLGGAGSLWPALGPLALFAAILLPSGFWVFRLALRKAKRDGSLTQF